MYIRGLIPRNWPRQFRLPRHGCFKKALIGSGEGQSRGYKTFSCSNRMHTKLVIFVHANYKGQTKRATVMLRTADNAICTTLFTLQWRMLRPFANRLHPDQARQNIGSDLDPICLTLRWDS